MIPAPRTREQALRQWVARQLDQSIDHIQLQPISSDAGFRRYFRFAEPSQWLAVDAPPQTEDTRQFVALAHHLSDHGVNTPRIFTADVEQGFLLVEDFGDELLYRQLHPDSAGTCYRQCFEVLLKLQACADDSALIPRYDQTLLHRELLIFTEWFVTALLGYSLTPADTQMLDELFHALEQNALDQPQTLVHRDFHSRNLLACQDGGLGVIDFQGALWGACTYDLVSLLRDCYIRWPASQVSQWVEDYRQLAQSHNQLPASVDAVQFQRWFDLMGLQRHIKVLGIFARLHLRDNKHNYLKDLPLVIRYCLEVAQDYPELHPFVEWFTQQLLPIIRKQSWYADIATAGDRL
jgi:N-acetylmuramate 1-kinase